MRLSLEDKQFLRSISNLVVNHPEHVKILFSIRRDSSSSIYDELTPVFDFINQYNPNNHEHKEYIKLLASHVDKIKNDDIKEFFKTTISSDQSGS